MFLSSFQVGKITFHHWCPPLEEILPTPIIVQMKWLRFVYIGRVVAVSRSLVFFSFLLMFCSFSFLLAGRLCTLALKNSGAHARATPKRKWPAWPPRPLGAWASGRAWTSTRAWSLASITTVLCIAPWSRSTRTTTCKHRRLLLAFLSHTHAVKSAVQTVLVCGGAVTNVDIKTPSIQRRAELLSEFKVKVPKTVQWDYY